MGNPLRIENPDVVKSALQTSPPTELWVGIRHEPMIMIVQVECLDDQYGAGFQTYHLVSLKFEAKVISIFFL